MNYILKELMMLIINEININVNITKRISATRTYMNQYHRIETKLLISAGAM